MTLGRMAAGLAYGGAVLLTLASRADAAAGELARCAEIDAPDARLACYDQLAGRTTAATPAVVGKSSVPVAPAGLPAQPPSAQPPSAQPPAPPAPAAAAEGATQTFGLTPAQQHKVPEGPASIQAHITNLSDRGGTPYVQLENGQLWMVTDAGAEAWLNLGDPVTIRRAALGSFLLTTKSKRSYHARRVQ